MGTEDNRHRARQAIEIPIAAAVVTVIPGIIGIATGQLLLFPSLAPTALMQAHVPMHETSHPYNVVVSHAGGLLSAFFAVWLFGLARAPSVFAVHALSWPRVWASGLAILLATLLEVGLRSPHPPAAATTLLAALGSFHPTRDDALTVMGGVIVVTIAGELMRRLRARTEARHAA